MRVTWESFGDKKTSVVNKNLFKEVPNEQFPSDQEAG